MLRTMHITPNPYKEGAWRMFYTGLCMRERGRIQRVGLAHSDDLFHWEKDQSGKYPLEVAGAVTRVEWFLVALPDKLRSDS